MRAASLLGFAQAAGALVSGETACELALRRGELRLLLIASDASPRTRDRLLHLANRHQVAWVEHGTKDELGAWIGKSPRAAVGVKEAQFARALSKALTAKGDDQGRASKVER